MHRDAEPGGRIVEDQANRFAAELLMPAAELREMLPTSMNARAWDTLGALKEQRGVSIQALLFRARRLGCIGDVTCRNAVIALTQRGWRRQEPGLATATEQPSLLPTSIELLTPQELPGNPSSTRLARLEICSISPRHAPRTGASTRPRTGSGRRTLFRC